MIAAFEGRHDEVIRLTHEVIDSGFGDQEVFYHWAGALAQAGDHDGSLGLLERAIEGGFHPASALVIDPRFDSVARHVGLHQDRAARRGVAASGVRNISRGGRPAPAGASSGVSATENS